jgi:hypothetical protein
MLHKDYDLKGSVTKSNLLVVILKSIGGKTKWLPVNR